MFGITNIYLYFTSVLIVILLPGPNSIYCLTTAARNGVKKGYQVVAAIIIGDGILMLVSTLGAASVLKSHPNLFIILKGCGAAYLSYLGFSILTEAYRQFRRANTLASASLINTKDMNLSENVFIKALTLSLTNPKAILFFMSFFILFVDPKYPQPAITFLALGLILELVSFSYLSVLVFLGTNLTRWFSQHIKLKILGFTLVGVLFLAFGITLLLATI